MNNFFFFFQHFWEKDRAKHQKQSEKKRWELFFFFGGGETKKTPNGQGGSFSPSPSVFSFFSPATIRLIMYAVACELTEAFVSRKELAFEFRGEFQLDSPKQLFDYFHNNEDAESRHIQVSALIIFKLRTNLRLPKNYR